MGRREALPSVPHGGRALSWSFIVVSFGSPGRIMCLPSDPSPSTSPFPFSVLKAVCVNWRTQKARGGPPFTGKDHCTRVCPSHQVQIPCTWLLCARQLGHHRPSALGPFHLSRLHRCSAWAVFTVGWYSVPGYTVIHLSA